MIEWKLYYEEHVPNHYNKAGKLNAWTEVSKKDMQRCVNLLHKEIKSLHERFWFCSVTIINHLLKELYLKPCQNSMMETFRKNS